MNRFLLILVIITIILPITLRCQSDLLLNNYRANRIVHNPAAIENNGMVNAYLGIHQQWIGFEDAPNMQWAHISNFFDKRSMGISLNIINQSVGAAATQNIKLNYLYRIYIRGGHNISLGVGAGIYFRKFNYSKLQFEDPETQISLSDESQIKPDFDFGGEYNYRNFCLGFASNHISVSNKKATVLKIPLQNHVYTSYMFEIDSDMSIVGGLEYFNSGSIDCVGASADFFLSNIFNAGVAYRSGTSFIIRAGLQITQPLNIQYSYDMGSGSFAKYNAGVHELVISAKLGKKSTAYNSPRFID